MDIQLMLKKISIMCLIVLTLLFIFQESQAYSGLVSAGYRLSNPIVKKLAEMGTKNGSKAVGQELGQIASKIPTAHRAVFLEHAYIDILVQQGKFTLNKADELIRNLSGVKGFQSAMSKACGLSDAKTKGHLYEIMVANEFKKKGYFVEIGKKFVDQIKKAPTDIDVLVSKNGNNFALELKNYNPKAVGYDSAITCRADMESLAAYAKEFTNTEVFFVMSRKPSDPNIAKLIEAYAVQSNVKLIYATESEVVRLVTLF